MGWMVQGSTPGRNKNFCNHPDQSWDPPSLPYSGYQACLPGVKQMRHGIDHLLPSSAKVKEEIELDFYSSSGPSWPVLRWTLPFTCATTPIRPFCITTDSATLTICQFAMNQGHCALVEHVAFNIRFLFTIFKEVIENIFLWLTDLCHI